MKISIMMLLLGSTFSPICMAATTITQVECKGPLQVGAPQTKLSIVQKNDGSAAAFFSVPKGPYHFQGSYHTIRDSFFGKVLQYDLVDQFGANASLQVSWSKQVGRGGCGRGGCDDSPKRISAILNFSGNQFAFVCHESVQ